MRKSFYRVISFMLAVVMLTMEAPVTAWATEIDEYSEEAVSEEVSEPEADDELLQKKTPENEKETVETDKQSLTEEVAEESAEDASDVLMEEDPRTEELEIPEGFEFVPGYVAAPSEYDYESPYADYEDDDQLFGMEEKYVSPIVVGKLSKNQNPYGTCWAFATMSAIEASAAKKGVRLPDDTNANKGTDLSELHLAYFSGKGVTMYDPLGGLDGDKNLRSSSYLFGGSVENASHILASWIGAADESKYTYKNDSTLSSYNTDYKNSMDDALHLRNYCIADPTTDRTGVKNLIKEYGAVTVSYWDFDADKTDESGINSQDEVYSSTYNSYYMPNTMNTNHAVSIVGWDDSFPRSNFAYPMKPSEDGAWLIRNSWVAGNYVDSDGNPKGSSAKYYSYFWLSYCDKSIGSSCFAFDMAPADNYYHNYQYDGCMTGGAYDFGTQYANIFKASSDSEALSAVFFSTHSANVDYSIDIYTGVTAGNPTSGEHAIDSQEGTLTYAGGHTIDLATPVDLNKDELFSVVITVSDGTLIDYEYPSTGGYVTTAYTESGRSMYHNGYRWIDIGNTGTGDLRIKAFTEYKNSTKYSVKLHANGGKFDNQTEIWEAKKNEGIEFALPTPTRTGYDFEGWYTSATGGSSVSSPVTISSNLTLYAHWKIKTYTLTLNANLGSFEGGSSTTTMNATYGQRYGQFPDPTRPGYKLVGWYDTSKPSGGNQITGESVHNMESDRTIYARWDYAQYKVTFEANGGECDIREATVTYSKKYTSLPTPTKEGYVFDAWYKESTFTNKVTANSTTVTATSDHTLYARWLAPVTVTFDANGGKIGSNTTTDITETYDRNYTLPSRPNRTGYTFKGWFTQREERENEESDQITTSVKVSRTDPHTLYAHWTANSYTLTLNANGGEYAEGKTTATKTVTYGAKYGTLDPPTRYGYELAGWSTSSSGQINISKDTVVEKAYSHTIYAKWNAATCVVKFDANGGKIGTDETQDITETFGSKYTLPATPVMEGYKFVGWFTDVEPEEQVTASTSVSTADAHTLYAHWVINSSIKVTFNPDKGSCSTSFIYVTYNAPYENLPTPTRDGYEFAGWYKKDGTTLVTNNSIVDTASDHQLTAHWTAKQYTITYDGNGGTPSKASDDVTFGSKYRTLATAERAGYEFSGWYTAATGGSKVTEATTVSTSNLDVSSNTHILYARWNAKQYTITYAGNGGTPSASSKTVKFGNQYGALASATRTGYTFKEWSTAVTGGKTVKASTVVSEDNFDTESETHYIYAQWTPNEYTVYFNGNGGTASKSSISVTYDSKYGANNDFPTATKARYDFDGWYTEATGGTEVTAETPVKITATQTLYAHWTGLPYKVNFNANGGTCDTAQKSVNNLGTYGDLPVATRPGYDFDGWYTAALGGSKITPSTTVNTTSDVTLYAHWNAKEYTITYVGNGGTPSPASGTVTFGNQYGALASATRPGYSFKEWSTAVTGGKTVNRSTIVSGDNLDTESETHYLYAQWTPNKYTVNFNGNGGTASKSGISVTYDSTYGANNDFPTATRAGYDFDGWYTEATGGTEVTVETPVKISAAQTLYAHWKGKSYTVNFNANGGTCGTGWKNVNNLGTYGELPEAERTGYSFDGWFTSASGGSRVTETTIVNITSDQTLYAHWTVKKFIVTFDANDGACQTQKTEVTYGGTYGKLPGASRSGYTHAGWYTDKTYENKIESNTRVTITEDLTLYAKWNANSYTVTYDANGGAIGSNTKTTASVTFGQGYGQMPVPVYAGYDFVGWYTAASGGRPVDATTLVGAPGNHTLYARWRGSRLEVTFDAQGGTLPDESEKRHVFYKDSYGFDDGVQKTLPTPTYEGHDFVGWFTAAEGGEKVLDTVVVADPNPHTLYAHWTVKKVYVTLNANGGKFASAREESIFISEYGSKITADALAVPAYGKRVFTGWFTDKDGNNAYDFDTVLSGDVLTQDGQGNLQLRQTLFAGWEEEAPYTGFRIEGLEDHYYEYTGSAVKPTFYVYYYDHDKNEERLLTSGTDYTVSYSNNVNAGTPASVNAKGESIAPAVTVKGKGNYMGATTEAFTINSLDIAAADAPDLYVTYNKKAQFGKTKVTYVLNGKTVTLKENKDFIFVFEEGRDYKAPGKYTTKIKGIGNYYGEKEYSQTIAKEAQTLISKVSVPKIPDQTYSGKDFVLKTKADQTVTDGETFAQTKSGRDMVDLLFVMKNGKTELTEGEDYTLSYSSNKEIGTATVTITAVEGSDYVGERTATFKITGTALSKYKMEKITDLPWTGEAREQSDEMFYYVTGSGNNAVKNYLIKDTDYTVSYSNNKEIGTATVIYTGINACTGTIKKTFKITGISMSSVTFPKDFTGTTGANGAIPYYDATAKAFIYTGKPFDVAGPEGAKSETGDNGIVLRVIDKKTKEVTYTLKNGKDYVISYKNKNSIPTNILPGTAEVTFTGINGCYGTVKKTFKISNYNIQKIDGSRISVTMPDGGSYPYTKGGVMPEPTVTYKFNGEETSLEKDKDYTLKWSDNNAVTTENTKKKPKVTITGKGAFTGSRVEEFSITGSSLNGGNVSVTAKDIICSDRPGNCKTSVTVTDKKTGKTLSAGTDYEKAVVYSYADETTVLNAKNPIYTGKKITGYRDKHCLKDSIVDQAEDIIPAGTKINVTVIGKGAYRGNGEDAGTVTGSFYVIAKDNDLSKANITIAPQVYTGSKITLEDKDITFVINREPKELHKGVEYEIIEDPKSNYTNKGTHKVTIVGKQEKGYGFSKTVSFQITAKSMDYTITYRENQEALINALAQKLYDKDREDNGGTAQKSLDQYKAECAQTYKIVGTMKSSSTPLKGKISKNAFKVQKLNDKNKWVNVSANEISFNGWNSEADGSGSLSIMDQGVFAPSWLIRLIHSNDKWDIFHTSYEWELFAQWNVR